MTDAANGSSQAPRRRGGRPRNADRPVVPWEEVDRLLVFGETVRDEETGRETVRFPSYRDLGRRYGVSGSLISRYGSQHQCIKRREENQRRERLEYEQKIVEKRAETRALRDEEAVGIADGYMRDFRDALAEGRVRTDSVSDFNTMARLKAFLSGKADARQEVHGVITLQQLQERHQAMRAQLASLDPVVAGTVVAHELGRGDRGEDGERLLLEEHSSDTDEVDPVLAGLERPRRPMPAAEERPRRQREEEEEEEEEDDDEVEVTDEAARDEELARELARRGKLRQAAHVRRVRDERAYRDDERPRARRVRDERAYREGDEERPRARPVRDERGYRDADEVRPGVRRARNERAYLDEDEERPRVRRMRAERAYLDDEERPRIRRHVAARRHREDRVEPRSRGERAVERRAPERRRPRLRGER